MIFMEYLFISSLASRALYAIDSTLTLSFHHHDSYKRLLRHSIYLSFIFTYRYLWDLFRFRLLSYHGIFVTELCVLTTMLREVMVAKNALAHSSFLLESVTRLHRGINQLDEERNMLFILRLAKGSTNDFK